MKISELIEQLEKAKAEHGDANIEVPVSVDTKTHPQAYCKIDWAQMGPFGVFRLHISLPSNMTVRKLKDKVER